MGNWKRDITRAIYLVLIVAVVGIIANWIRTPILDAAAENGRISRARARMLSGVNLIDSWDHQGWPEVVRQTDGDGDPEDDPGDGDDNGEEPDDDGGDGPGEAGEALVWPIDIFQAKDLYDSGECTFFDAREQEYYEEEHIAGAHNWPADVFDLYFSEYADLVDVEDCIVVYCIGGACDESYHLGISLVAEGFEEIYLFEGGMEEWTYSGYPVTVGPEP